jgi:hypothetical protein
MSVKYYFGQPHIGIPNFTLLERSGSSWWGVGFTDDKDEQTRLDAAGATDCISKEQYEEYLKKKQPPPGNWTQVRGARGVQHVPIVPGDNPAAERAAKDGSPKTPVDDQPLEKKTTSKKPRLPKSEKEFLEPTSLPDFGE